MSLSFLSPLAALLAFAAAAPLAAFLVTELRARRVGSVLGLPAPSWSSRLPGALAVCAVMTLLALAAAQPVLSSVEPRYARTDAQAWFVFDTSRSMLAAPSPDAPTRFERARVAGKRVRAQLGDVPAGVASLTNRAVPHLFPTIDAGVFEATVDRALGIEKPPPDVTAFSRVTTFAALASLARQSFFAPAARRRLVVVFTDGEGRPFASEQLRRLFGREPGIETIFVRFWAGDERIFTKHGLPEADYRPDPASGRTLGQLAGFIGGRAFSEAELDAVARAGRAFLGRGPKVEQGQERTATALAPYVLLSAFMPLAFLLRRRNL